MGCTWRGQREACVGTMNKADLIPVKIDQGTEYPSEVSAGILRDRFIQRRFFLGFQVTSFLSKYAGIRLTQFEARRPSKDRMRSKSIGGYSLPRIGLLHLPSGAIFHIPSRAICRREFLRLAFEVRAHKRQSLVDKEARTRVSGTKGISCNARKRTACRNSSTDL